jgi:hypothetical protein
MPCGAFLHTLLRTLPIVYRHQLALLLHGTFASPGLDMVLCFVAGGRDPYLARASAEDTEWDKCQRAFSNTRARMRYCPPLSAPLAHEVTTVRAESSVHARLAESASPSPPTSEPSLGREVSYSPVKTEELSYDHWSRQEFPPNKRPLHLIDQHGEMDPKRPRYNASLRIGADPSPLSPPPSTVSASVYGNSDRVSN